MIKKLLFLLIIFTLFAIPAAADTNVTNNHITWAGYIWDWPTWSTALDTRNCWVDDAGNLHMTLRQISGEYKGAYLESPETYQYGKFTWVAESESLSFERKTTVGLCTYYSNLNEIDIELNQWYDGDDHIFYSNQPAGLDLHPWNVSYGVPDDSPYLHEENITYTFEWTPAYILYNSTLEDGTVLHSHNYSVPSAQYPARAISAKYQTVCIGFLCLGGTTGPDSGNPFHLVLSDYQYDPMRPTASFTASSTTGTTDTVFSFSDTSTGIPKSWNWNFGDSTTSSAQNPTHTYSVPGTYTVTLTAWNPISSDVETKTSYIIVSEGVDPVPPVAGFTANVTSGNNPLTVAFEDQTSNTPTSWSWNFGDGSANSTAQNPTHTYSADGVYTVTLNATNAIGSDVEIKSGYITVSTTPGTTISPYENYMANYNFETWSGGTENVAPTGWELAGSELQQVGGSRSSDSAIGDYSYAIAGDGETDIRGHIAQFPPESVKPTKLSAWVKKTTGSTGGIQFFVWNGAENYKGVLEEQLPDDTWTYFEWELAPGSTGATEIDTYSTGAMSGTWLIDGVSVSNTTSITGETESLTADAIYSNFSYTPSQLFANSNLVTEYHSYTLSEYDVSGITAYVDGVAKTTYYIDNMVYLDTTGLTAAAHDVSIKASLNEDLSPVADFSGNETYGINTLTVGFTDLSTGSPTSWFWEFGDGYNSTSQNPVHVYSTPGIYGVTLNATNTAGSDTESKTTYINVVAGPQTPVQWFYYIFSFRWW